MGFRLFVGLGVRHNFSIFEPSIFQLLVLLQGFGFESGVQIRGYWKVHEKL